MKTFQILTKNGVPIAIDTTCDNALNDINQMIDDGFQLEPETITASSAELAIVRFRANQHAPIKPSMPFSIKSVLLFNTSDVPRLRFFGYSASAFIAFLVLTLGFTSNGNTLLIPILLCVVGLFWFSVGITVARWKNCGHGGWYYLAAVILTSAVDAILHFGIASFGLLLYLLFKSPK